LSVNEATTPNQRNQQDQDSLLGIATTRFEERVACSLGQGTSSGIQFEEGACAYKRGCIISLTGLSSSWIIKDQRG
jgi:hypothetical protein